MNNIPSPQSNLEVTQPLDKTFLSPDFEYPKGRINDLMNSWDFEFKATDYRRRARNITVNVADLRQQGKLKPDETIIPIRLIETNIKREEPAKIAYIKQSQRLAIFKPQNRAKVLNVETLEKEFTRVGQYPGWEIDYIKIIDGAATHGWAGMEIEFNEAKPGKFSVDYIEHENLLFPLDAKSLEACEFICRVRHVTVSQLRTFVQEFSFEQQQVELVIQSTQPVRISNTISAQSVPLEDSLREIVKIWFKLQGVVYVAWFSKECTGWLKQPAKLYLGKRDQKMELVTQNVPVQTGTTPWGAPMVENVPTQIPQLNWVDREETNYPVKILPYEENEQPQIKDRKGRVYKDDYKQEAQLAIWSSFVNGCVRASNIHAAPKNATTGAAPKQTNVIVEHGKLWTEPVEFFHTPYPDPIVLGAAQALDLQNTQETLQLSYTVQNRKDSRKTAEEVKGAKEDQSLITGVQVTLLSIFMRSVLNDCWQICQSQAMQGKIVFCAKELAPEEYVNDTALIGEIYDIFAAGDVDVVERQAKLQKMLQLYPVYSTTPLGMEYLVDMTRLAFPDMAEKYEAILRTGFMQQQAQIASGQMQPTQTTNTQSTEENDTQLQ